MDKDEINRLVAETAMAVKGLERVALLLDEDRQQIRELEKDAEARSLMGLGKVINTGVKAVLACSRVYVALTSMAFDWGCHSTLMMKKGEEVVGEEIRDAREIARLSARKDVWFLHKNFVVYKERISFPGDIMKKICYFEIPPISGDWCIPAREEFPFRYATVANPALPCDVHLKERYFNGNDERGLGTILMGFTPSGPEKGGLE